MDEFTLVSTCSRLRVRFSSKQRSSLAEQSHKQTKREMLMNEMLEGQDRVVS